MNLENIIKKAFIIGFASLSSFFFSCEKHELKITYTIQKGDTLGKIAGDKCGDRNLWKQIASYNQSIDPNFNPDKIEIGQLIYLPDGCFSGDVPAVEPEQPKEAAPQNYPKEEGEGGRYTAVDQQEIEGNPQNYYQEEPTNCQENQITRHDDGIYRTVLAYIIISKYQPSFPLIVPGFEHEYKIEVNEPLRYQIDIIPNRCTDRYNTMDSNDLGERGSIERTIGPYCNDIVHTDQFGWYKNFCEMEFILKISQSANTPPSGCHLAIIKVKAKKLEVASGNYSCTGP